FTARIQAFRERIEGVLDRALELPDAGTSRLREAMRYSVLGAGKRLRPTLVYLTGESLGAPLTVLDVPAAAVELIHVYSLVHDDLPAMDDDDLRRGRPTCHRAFDEGTAILVGDALQALGFAVLSSEPMAGTAAAAARQVHRRRRGAPPAHLPGHRGTRRLPAARGGAARCGDRLARPLRGARRGARAAGRAHGESRQLKRAARAPVYTLGRDESRAGSVPAALRDRVARGSAAHVLPRVAGARRGAA